MVAPEDGPAAWEARYAPPGADGRSGKGSRGRTAAKAAPREEWYATFEEIYPVLQLYLREEFKAARILHVGCGLSRLAEGLWRNGYTNIVNVDASESAIRACRERDAHLQGVEYLCMDATDLSRFPESSFDFVIDKAFLDAIFSTIAGVRSVSRTLQGISRVLRPGGYYLSISASPKHCRYTHFKRPQFEWAVDSVRVANDPGAFVYACRKRAFHREWFFGDPGALELKREAEQAWNGLA